MVKILTERESVKEEKWFLSLLNGKVFLRSKELWKIVFPPLFKLNVKWF